MPNRQKGKHAETMDKIRPGHRMANPSSNRSRGRGVTLADGKFYSPFDLYLMEKQGCDFTRVAPGLT
jgi:hypothetical protein